MKFVLNRGYLSSIKEVRYEKQDKTQGIAYYLMVKERIGEGEFATQVTHYVRLKENTDKVKFDSYVDHVVSLTGVIYGRKTNDNVSFFGTYVIESIDDIEVVE